MSQQFASNDPRLAEPAFRAFTSIAKAWALTDLEQSKILGQSVDDAFAVLVTGIVGDRWPDTLERVSFVIGIYAALHSVFRNQEQADGWIRRPNQAALFGGGPALALMCSGRVEDLASVREHIEGQGICDA